MLSLSLKMQWWIEGGGGGELWIGWLATSLLEKLSIKKEMKKTVNINITFCRNKGKHPRQVPHYNSYFVALLVFLVLVIVFNKLGPNSLITIVCGHGPLILRPQGTVYSLEQRIYQDLSSQADP